MNDLPPLICNVCNVNTAKGVYCSGLGPCSFAYCQTCGDKLAEPEGMFEATLESCGTEVADWVTEMSTWKAGKYLTWAEWLAQREGVAP